ncbi:MAG: hypothetical protein ACLUVC_10740 [Longibaculum sp.]
MEKSCYFEDLSKRLESDIKKCFQQFKNDCFDEKYNLVKDELSKRCIHNLENFVLQVEKQCQSIEIDYIKEIKSFDKEYSSLQEQKRDISNLFNELKQKVENQSYTWKEKMSIKIVGEKGFYRKIEEFQKQLDDIKSKISRIEIQINEKYIDCIRKIKNCFISQKPIFDRLFEQECIDSKEELETKRRKILDYLNRDYIIYITRPNQKDIKAVHDCMVELDFEYWHKGDGKLEKYIAERMETEIKFEIYDYDFWDLEQVIAFYENQIKLNRSDAYDDGYKYGHEIGYDKGYEKGEDYGYDRGYEVGYDNGYSDGYDYGFAVG